MLLSSILDLLLLMSQCTVILFGTYVHILIYIRVMTELLAHLRTGIMCILYVVMLSVKEVV